MRGIWRGAALALMLMLLSASAGAAQTIGPTVAIGIVDAPRVQSRWGFAPATRKVAPGTWVTWSNNGQDAHTVTAVDTSFDSGNLDPSEGFSWYFDQSGTFPYICALHPWMTGTIVVGSGQPSAVSAQPAVDSATGGSAAPPTDPGSQPAD